MISKVKILFLDTVNIKTFKSNTIIQNYTEINKSPQEYGDFSALPLWWGIADMVRTEFTDKPESFEIDAEFFEMNPQTTRETFEQYLWDNHNSGEKVYLNKPTIINNATPIRTNI